MYRGDTIITWDANFQEDGFFERRVAAADDGIGAEEEPIPGGTGRDAVPGRVARGNPGNRATRRSHESASDCAASRSLDLERPSGQLGPGDVALNNLGAEPFGLRAHVGDQFRAHDAVAEPRKVIDRGRQHQLTAGLEPLDDQRPEVGPRRVQRGRESRRARSDDGDPAIRTHLHVPVDQLLQMILVGQTDDRLDDLAAFEDKDRRDAADAEATGGARVLVHVQLANRDLAVVIVGERIDRRGQAPARAPLC